jgi:hypothetical protein
MTVNELYKRLGRYVGDGYGSCEINVIIPEELCEDAFDIQEEEIELSKVDGKTVAEMNLNCDIR